MGVQSQGVLRREKCCPFIGIVAWLNRRNFVTT
jgi:hypothetical protein